MYILRTWLDTLNLAVCMTTPSSLGASEESVPVEDEGAQNERTPILLDALAA